MRPLRKECDKIAYCYGNAMVLIDHTGVFMFEFTIELAGKRIGIVSRYEEIREMCAEYLTDEAPDFIVESNREVMEREWQKYLREAKVENQTIYLYPRPYLETLAIYRMIAERMMDFDTILFHGSVVSVDGEGYLFTATSGTGKSTHTANWRKVFGDRAVMVNDDKPLLRITGDQVLVYGTPWDGKHRLSTNTVVPLKGLCILTRAEENHIEKITVAEAIPMLLQQCYRPADPVQLSKVLKLLDKLSTRTGLYRLGCNMDPEAAIVAYNGMNGKDETL
jgi:hypothetical protein